MANFFRNLFKGKNSSMKLHEHPGSTGEFGISPTNPFLVEGICYKISLSLNILMMMTSACNSSNQIKISLPGAEPPIVESIFVPSTNGGRVVAQNTGGDYNVFPAERFELRVRAPLLTNFEIIINGNRLEPVNDSAQHPEYEGTGYWSFVSDVMPGVQEGFYRFLVHPPVSLRSGPITPTLIQIKNISQNSSLPPESREAGTTLQFTGIDPNGNYIYTVTEPNTVFDKGWNSKDDRKSWIFDILAHASLSIVSRKVTLAGWIKQTSPNSPHPDSTTDDYVERLDQREDWHYTLWLDPDFIERTYGRHPNAAPLSGATLKGNPNRRGLSAHQMPLLLPQSSVDISTFLLPAKSHFDVELNAWHISKRGAPPSNWVSDPDPAYSDNAWPFPPKLPYRQSVDEDTLSTDDYVIISGTLWQDSGHQSSESACWNTFFRSQDGWLEIHPVDMVRRVSSPKIRKQPHLIALCAPPNFPKFSTSLLSPLNPQPPNPDSKLQWKEYIDYRFTDMNTVKMKDVFVSTNSDGYPALRVNLKVEGTQGGRFSAVYVLWWD